MLARIRKIVPSSYVDGPGQRSVVFFQGCPIHCLGCQSRQTWDAAGGHQVDVDDLAETLALLSAKHGSVTISGGEPFAQPEALAQLVEALRVYGVRHITVYTGYLADAQLLDRAHPAFPFVHRVFGKIDVLVDGPFKPEFDEDFVAWRGGWNQRVIDMPATIRAGRPICLNWDGRMTITPQGEAVLPAGLADELTDLGTSHRSPMCGQINR